MRNIDVPIAGQNFQGIEVSLPKAPLVLVHGARGFVMCGYLNVEVADKLGVACAMVRGVKTVDDLLAAPVQAVSKEAAVLGVQTGMTGREALQKLV